MGKSRNFLEVLRLAETVAPTDSTLLISGESGTGKEVLARYIHSLSDRSDAVFHSINCGALPESLLESELFGHVKGAFTGAVKDTEGLLVAAAGGTFFLDEVGEMSPATQVKLLRALQEREVIPVGSTQPVPVDVRLIAATNRELEDEIRRGKFRSDLYYRLNVIALHLPPLRERREDIPMLVEHFLRRFSRDSGKPIDEVDPMVMAELERYDWPGNVRELENTIERAVVLATGPRLTRDTLWLMGASATPSPGLPSMRLHANLEWTEKETIRRALEQAHGIKKDAAELMGISQRALSHYLQKYRFD